MGHNRFDVRAYTRAPYGPSHVTAVTEMDPQLRDALRYLQRRLQGTTTWMSHVLVTATHKNARITAFLSTWAYEHHWQGETLGALAGPASSYAIYEPRRIAFFSRRFGALREAIFANLHGDRLTTVQMTEQLVNNWLLEAFIDRLTQLSPASIHEHLAQVKEALLRQDQFFQEAALPALTSSPSARQLARRRLSRRAWPIGTDSEHKQVTRATVTTLFGKDRSWATTLDQRINELPGLAGLNLATRATH